MTLLKYLRMLNYPNLTCMAIPFQTTQALREEVRDTTPMSINQDKVLFRETRIYVCCR